MRTASIPRAPYSRPLRVLVVAAAVAGATLVLAPGALAAPGDLDTTFGTGGVTLTAAGGNSAFGAESMVRQSDGKLVVAGTGTDSSGNVVTEVARYTADGMLDSSFGNAGSGITTLPPLAQSSMVDPRVALEPGGAIVVAGTLLNGGPVAGRFGVVRLSGANGSLDTTFAGGATVVNTQIGDANSDRVIAVAVDPASGRIFVGGQAQSGGTGEFALAAYDANGTQVAGFGSSGTVMTAVAGGDAQIQSLALDGTAIVAAGLAQAGSAAALTRYTATGAVDPSFGGGTPVTLAIGGGSSSAAYSVLVQANGKILVGGTGTFSGTGCLALVSLNADGTTDTGFGSGGTVHDCVGQDSVLQAIAATPDGIYAAGYTFDGSLTHLTLSHFALDGTLDTAFGANGTATSDPNGTSYSSQATALVLDGSSPPLPIVAGSAQAASGTVDFALERFQAAPSSSQDTTPPTITVSVPVAGRHYTVGQSVTASYSCADSGSGVASCSGPVASGARISTSSAGTHTFAVTAKDHAGNQAQQSVVYYVDAAPPAPPAPPANLSAPVLSAGSTVNGRAALGTALSATVGTWRAASSFAYTWRECIHDYANGALDLCRTISGATGSTYQTSAADARHYLYVTVTATNAGGTTSSSSRPLQVDQPLPGATGQALENHFALGNVTPEREAATTVPVDFTPYHGHKNSPVEFGPGSGMSSSLHYWTISQAQQYVLRLAGPGVKLNGEVFHAHVLIIPDPKGRNEIYPPRDGLAKDFASEVPPFAVFDQTSPSSWRGTKSNPVHVRVFYYDPSLDPKPVVPKVVAAQANTLGPCGELAQLIGAHWTPWDASAQAIAGVWAAKGCHWTVSFKKLDLANLTGPTVISVDRQSLRYATINVWEPKTTLTLTVWPVRSDRSATFMDNWTMPTSAIGTSSEFQVGVNTAVGLITKSGQSVTGLNGVQVSIYFDPAGSSSSRLLTQATTVNGVVPPILLRVSQPGRVRIEAVAVPGAGDELEGSTSFQVVEPPSDCFVTMTGRYWWKHDQPGHAVYYSDMIAGRGSEAGKLILLGNCPARPDRSALFVHGSAVESSRAVGLTERSPSAHTSGGLPGWLSWFVSLFSGSGHDGGHVTAPKSSDPCVPAQIALGAGLSSSPRPGVQTTAPVEASDGHRAYTATSANAVELQGGTAATSECRTEAGTAAVKLTSSLSLAGTTLNISNVIAAGGGNVIAAGGGNVIAAGGGN